jgi:hypothetical protein
MNGVNNRILNFERNVSVGDILTSVSILLAAFGLLWQLSKDHDLDSQKQANEIRSAAARTLASIERWRFISALIFEEIQPIFVETSEKVKTEGDVQLARDYLYKTLRTEYAKVQNKLSDEKSETAYVELFKFHPSMRTFFSSMFCALQEDQKKMFDELLSNTEIVVLDANPNTVRNNSAILGNALRGNAVKIKKEYLSKTNAVIQPMQNFLAEIILRRDAELLDRRNLVAPQPQTVGNCAEERG